MRKYLLLALTAFVALAVTSVASAQDIQTIETSVKPAKLDKKKFKPVTLFVDVETANNDESTTFTQPPKATNTKVDFSKNLKFDTKAVPNCLVTDAQITNQPASAAKTLCGPKSQVSVDGAGTQGVVTVDFTPNVPDTPTDLTVAITAFNGNAPNTIYLHTDPAGIPTKPVLTGKLGKAPTGYGNRLDVTIPPLAAGAISSFKTQVKNGKYIQGTCKDKTPSTQVSSVYTDHTPTSFVEDSTCKRKSASGGGGGGKGK